MSKIDDLIRTLCPEGVKSLDLGSLCRIETGKRDANESVENGEFLFFTTARESSRIDSFRWDCEALLVAGNANVGNVKHYIGKFDAYQRTYVLTEFLEGMDAKYLYYALQNNLNFYLDSNKNVAAMTYIVLGTLKAFKVPIPPLKIQKEIVSILDKFTQLEAELEAELEARRTQYEVTRERLLDFSGDLSAHPMGEQIRELCPEGVVFRKLGEFGKIYTGLSGKTKADFSDGNSPFVSYSDIGNNASLPQAISSRVKIKAGEKQNSIRLGDLLFTGSSEDRVGIGLTSEVQYEPEVPTYVNSFCFGFRPLEGLFSTGFLKHCLRSSSLRKSIMACSNGVTRINISKKNLLEILVPQPPLEAQREIVDILDKLDALVNDISHGLPAEIVTRRKQYEYYRNKLLTFKEMDAA